MIALLLRFAPLLVRLGFALLILGMLLFAIGSCRASELVLGDSIACGVGQALHAPTKCRVGAGSCEIARYRYPHVDRLIISAGINDAGLCVSQVRARARANQVLWIVPAPINQAHLIVLGTAQTYRDKIIGYSCRPRCTSRNFHPASYGQLGRDIHNVFGW